MLLDLAQFQNVQQNAQMAVTGTHQFGNLNTGAKSATQFLDTPDGQFSVVKNTNNLGKMYIQGNHQYDNYVNNGQTQVVARKYSPPRRLEDLQEDEEELEDLASFQNYNNMKGGMTSIQGTHQFKNMNNAKGGKVIVLDHKTGQFSTFDNTNNAGMMQVSGNHQFNNTQNSGQFVVNPRQFKLMDLAQINQVMNNAGGKMQVTGNHAFKTITNAKADKKKKLAAGMIVFKDHKDGQKSTVGTLNNAGNTSIQGNHMFNKAVNSGNVTAMPRAFPEKKLMDLAAFNNFANQAGGNAQFTGTHQVKNFSNAVKGIVIFNDDPKGRFTTVGNTNNMGQMRIAGLHQFNNFQNGGQVAVTPRTFDAKGRPIKALLI